MIRRNHLEGWTGVASLTVNQDKNNFVIYFYLLVNVIMLIPQKDDKSETQFKPPFLVFLNLQLVLELRFCY